MEIDFAFLKICSFLCPFLGLNPKVLSGHFPRASGSPSERQTPSESRENSVFLKEFPAFAAAWDVPLRRCPRSSRRRSWRRSRPTRPTRHLAKRGRGTGERTEEARLPPDKVPSRGRDVRVRRGDSPVCAAPLRVLGPPLLLHRSDVGAAPGLASGAPAGRGPHVGRRRWAVLAPARLR
jgi:hypothetical protein